MPRYEYRCRACGATFERTRPMAESSAPAQCPQGHDDTVKLLSTVSVGGRAGWRGQSQQSAGWRGQSQQSAGWQGQSQQSGAEPRGGGGCCGGACGCR